MIRIGSIMHPVRLGITFLEMVCFGVRNGTRLEFRYVILCCKFGCSRYLAFILIVSKNMLFVFRLTCSGVHIIMNKDHISGPSFRFCEVVYSSGMGCPGVNGPCLCNEAIASCPFQPHVQNDCFLAKVFQRNDYQSNKNLCREFYFVEDLLRTIRHTRSLLLLVLKVCFFFIVRFLLDIWYLHWILAKVLEKNF